MLNVHSYYSLRYGTVSPEEIVKWATISGYKTIALTDINNTSAVLSYTRLMQKQGLPVVAGIDFRNGIDCCYVGIAKNNEGFMELNAFLSHHLETETSFPEQAPDFSNSYIIYPWGKHPQQLRPHERIGIAPHHFNKVRLHPPKDWSECVAFQPMTFFSKQHYNTHRLLRAIDCNTLLANLSENQQTRPDEYYFDKKNLLSLFHEYPFLIEQAQQLINSCHLTFSFGDQARQQNQHVYFDSKATDYKKIYDLCMENLSERYPDADESIYARIQKELDVIRQKDYLSYFLLTWDIISYAQKCGYFYVGRGSGANSIIAYLLKITDVDPIDLDLYFERFINLYRKNPPDFDIDFSWKDRDDVIQYIFGKFRNVAMLCTYTTFQYRATIRELGKIMGLPKSSIDNLSRDKPAYDEADHIGKLVLKYSKLITGFPSYLSVHAGGLLISEKPIHWFCATSLTSKGFRTTQFSMLEAEDVGFYKFDILSQRGLGKIKDCLEIIRTNQPYNPPADIRDVHRFKTDENINTLLRQAKALGCFYVESPGMRMLMTKLRTSGYLELVAASSIIRPGVAQSGMMREYILRHRHPEKRKEANPTLLEIMPETYGIMVYQEDVIKVANQFADLSLEESDVLRRAMSGKYRSREEFQIVRKKFFENCRKKNFKAEDIESVWVQIESFAGFAFSKGHSASYAVESYQCLYLKTYYPLEYIVAVINNGGGFYRTEIYVRELQLLGATVETPCINTSKLETSIYNRTVYIGFQHIAELESATIEQLLKEREYGEFTSFHDFRKRVPVSVEQTILLIRVGAFRKMNVPKKKLIWATYLSLPLLKAMQLRSKETGNGQQELFQEHEDPLNRTFDFPSMEEEQLETYFEQMELLGFPIESPFDLLESPLLPHQTSLDLPSYEGKEVLIYGYFVNLKRTTTKNQEQMLFGTFYDENGHDIDTVHFPDTASAFPLRGIGIYEIRGIVTVEFEFPVIEVSSLKKLNYCPDPRYSLPETSPYNRKEAAGKAASGIFRR